MFAEGNFKFCENGRKFWRWVENTVGKGEIARFLQCFQKTCTEDMLKPELVSERVNKFFACCVFEE